MNPDRPITIFDARSTLDPPVWDSYSWRIRLVLNYKGLHHRTEWISFPDISSTIASLGVRANREQPFYTTPVIRGENRLEVIMNCAEIVKYLESEYDWMRPVIPQGTKDAQARYVDQINKYITARMVLMVIPQAVQIMEEGRERDHFVQTMFDKFGIPLPEIFPPEKQDDIWKALYAGLDIVSNTIDNIERNPGEEWPFGKGTPTYADFALCGTLILFDKVGPDGGWDKIKERNGGKWERLYEACRPFMDTK